MQEMLLTDDPKIVNGSKLSKEELKQLLKKPSPKLEKAVLFLLTDECGYFLFSILLNLIISLADNLPSFFMKCCSSI